MLNNILGDFTGDNSLGRARQVTLEDGTKLWVKASDPYGFWRVSYDKGKPDPKFDQEFTSFAKALAFIEGWSSTRKKGKATVAMPENAKEVDYVSLER